MADTTISPIPYNGGTINYSDTRHRTSIPLTSDLKKWVYGFFQSSPDYTILGVVEYSSALKNSSPTISQQFQRAFTGNLWNVSSSTQYGKLFSLSSTRFFLYSSDSTYASKIYDTSSNDILEVSSNSITNQGAANGNRLSSAVVPINNNRFLLIRRAGGPSLEILDIQFTDGSAFTYSTVKTLTLNNSGENFVRYKYIDSDNILIYTARISSGNRYIGTKVYKYTISTNTSSLLPSLPAEARGEPVVLSSGDILFIRDNTNWYRVDSSLNLFTYNKQITPGTLSSSIHHSTEFGINNFVVSTRDGNYQIMNYDATKEQISTAVNSLSPVSYPTFSTSNTTVYQDMGTDAGGTQSETLNNANQLLIKYDDNTIVRRGYVTNEMRWPVQFVTFE